MRSDLTFGPPRAAAAIGLPAVAVRIPPGADPAAPLTSCFGTAVASGAARISGRDRIRDRRRARQAGDAVHGG